MSENDEVVISDTGLSEEQIGALMAPLNPKRVQSRAGTRGASLSYLAAYDVKATLIRLFGFGGFSAETIHTEVLDLKQYPKDDRPSTNWTATAYCTVRLTIPALGCVYTESASSSQVNPQPGEAVDFAIKTAESDALKRAATYLGTQFGLGLYDSGSTREVVHVLIEPTQAALLARYREGREEVVDTEKQALVNRAMASKRGPRGLPIEKDGADAS